MNRVYDKNRAMIFCITCINMVRYSVVVDAYSLPTRSDFEGEGIIFEDIVFQENGTRQSLAPEGCNH